MTTVLFVVAGVLFFLAALLIGYTYPRIPLIKALDWKGWPRLLGVGCAIGGWGLLWWLLANHRATEITLLAATVPLSLACLSASWRMWSMASHHRFVGVLMAGVVPPVVLSLWALRGGVGDVGWIPLWVLAVTVVAGSAWYFAYWFNPAMQLKGNEWATVLEAVPSDAEAIKTSLMSAGASPEVQEDAKTLAFLARTAEVLLPRQRKELLLPGGLALLAVVLSGLLWRVAPGLGWLGVAGAVAAVPPLITRRRIRRWRARWATFPFVVRAFRALTIAAILFAAGQLFWAWTALASG